MSILRAAGIAALAVWVVASVTLCAVMFITGLPTP